MTAAALAHKISRERLTVQLVRKRRNVVANLVTEAWEIHSSFFTTIWNVCDFSFLLLAILLRQLRLLLQVRLAPATRHAADERALLYRAYTVCQMFVMMMRGPSLMTSMALRRSFESKLVVMWLSRKNLRRDAVGGLPATCGRRKRWCRTRTRVASDIAAIRAICERSCRERECDGDDCSVGGDTKVLNAAVTSLSWQPVLVRALPSALCLFERHQDSRCLHFTCIHYNDNSRNSIVADRSDSLLWQIYVWK